jgi:DNA-binding NtrC family response regulator
VEGVDSGAGDRSARERLIKSLRDSQTLRKLVGRSPCFLRAIASIPAFARGDASVVVSGETGTGKELVARALHYAGPRAGYPFVPVNCGSLTDTLLQDELFGHERGAFTDAKAARGGLLARADRGTLFLDEVDSLTPRAQVALLRVLQDKSFRVLGSAHERQVDVRFISACNTPLRTLVQEGSFRGDLFYRLSVLTIDLPPLRDRRDDVILLARHFLAKNCEEATPPTLSAGAQRALLAYDWPGNIRELENVVIRAMTLAVDGPITEADLGLDAFCPPDVAGAHRPGAWQRPQQPNGGASFRDAKRAALEAFELEYLSDLLRCNGGNISRAARSAGKERHDLRRLLKKHRLDPLRFSAPCPGEVERNSPTPWGHRPPPR